MGCGVYGLNAGKGVLDVRYPDLRRELAAFDRKLLARLEIDDGAFYDLQVWYAR